MSRLAGATVNCRLPIGLRRNENTNRVARPLRGCARRESVPRPMTSVFMTLGDLVFTPPLPAVVSLLLVAGAAGTSELIVRKLQEHPTAIRRVAAFVLVLAICGAVVNALMLAGFATLPALRGLAVVMVAAGCATVAGTVRRIPAFIDDARRGWRAASPGDRVVMLIVTIAALGLLLAALAPVTDADSLDYHLGVPLEWLRRGSFSVQPHWLHARLTGLGEALNMLGLAAGSDSLGAVLQVGGLMAVMTVLWAEGRTVRDRLFGLLLALPPAILPLTTTQKPQLLPAAAVAIGMILTGTASSTFDFALVFGCAAFAMACKLSFLVSGGVVFAAALFVAHKRGKLLGAGIWATIALGTLVGPVLGRNWFLYGDPLSPFLEGLRPHPDPEVIQFADYLQNVGGPHTAAGILGFLSNVLLPSGIGEIQTILGIGIFAPLLLLQARKAPSPRAARQTLLLGGGAVILLFTMWRGQMSPRYLLEPWLWCAAAAVKAPWSKLKSVLFHGLTIQTAGVSVMALAAAVTLFPGALTPALRDRVMRYSTFGYEEALWLSRVIPPGERVMVDSRAYALFTRPFSIPACASCGGADLLDLVHREDFGDGGTAILVPNYPVDGTLPDGCLSDVIAGPEPFIHATRNPFNRREYSAIALRIRCR